MRDRWWWWGVRLLPLCCWAGWCGVHGGKGGRFSWASRGLWAFPVVRPLPLPASGPSTLHECGCLLCPTVDEQLSAAPNLLGSGLINKPSDVGRYLSIPGGGTISPPFLTFLYLFFCRVLCAYILGPQRVALWPKILSYIL